MFGYTLGSKQAVIYIYIYFFLLLTAIGGMPGGSVYKDNTFNKETAHLTKTAQYIARIFTIKYKYMNIHSTIQVHEHYRTLGNRKYRSKQDEYTARK
jgi:exopolysaccharide biosynthesis protein